jgi:hypothetical protein
MEPRRGKDKDEALLLTLVYPPRVVNPLSSIEAVSSVASSVGSESFESLLNDQPPSADVFPERS